MPSQLLCKLWRRLKHSPIVLRYRKGEVASQRCPRLVAARYPADARVITLLATRSP